MKHSETKTKHFKRWLWMPLFAGIIFVGTGCKNTSGGTGWPISAPAGVDPLMGNPPAIAPARGGGAHRAGTGCLTHRACGWSFARHARPKLHG